MTIRTLICALLISGCAATQTQPSSSARDISARGPIDGPGALVIAGGAVAADNAAIYEAFVAQIDWQKSGDLMIVPAASGFPQDAADIMHRVFATYGVPAERIHTAQLAVEDDPTTTLDESRWRENANDPDLSNKLAEAAGIWFTGGDQSRTVSLLQPLGVATATLSAIRSAHANGAVIGGTSAGAAIMSREMILGGDSMPALTGGASPGEVLSVGAGLGFYPYALVDQHFDARARLGRLVAALAQIQDPSRRIGFGVDENTALLVLPSGDLTVAGASSVVMVDARNAQFSFPQGRLRATGILLSVLTAGDHYRLSTGELIPAPHKNPTLGNEYNDRPIVAGGGIAFPASSLAQMLGEDLLDNRAASQMRQMSFDEAGNAAIYAFTQTADSRGYYGRDSDDQAHYSLFLLDFAILPARVAFEELP